MGSNSENSTTGDINKIYTVVGAIFFLVRTWMDVFILTINCRDRRRKKCLSTTDRILTFQGSIRICLGCTIMTWIILNELRPPITQTHYLFKASMFSFWYFVSCNVWLTASLCSYYCVKIADFSHPFFIRLKLRLPGLESSWLLGSAVLALASSLPFVLEIPDSGNIPDFLQNKNGTDITHAIMAFRTRVLLGLGYFAAFGICATSAALLLFSLWRHRQRMLGNWGSHRTPQTDTHFRAVITILSLLVNSVVGFVSIQVLLSRDYEESSVYHLVASAVLFGCFSVESLISIWGNKKFKNELRRSLYFVKCRGCVC